MPKGRSLKAQESAAGFLHERAQPRKIILPRLKPRVVVGAIWHGVDLHRRCGLGGIPQSERVVGGNDLVLQPADEENGKAHLSDVLDRAPLESQQPSAHELPVEPRVHGAEHILNAREGVARDHA
eukprot:CAMPEP_0195654554 /NCGR_PEP_ID=MMETSP0815-20121206/33981_1 /TAXON_ID=97485 /ORGANISM="Prymnesium parvum, Strain Texoma1" /LENGTH=124 /DNA_ID=CAMNT_0040798771 /DNA_START=127 /DNA_END=498 /DNA_ORIENTATION=+